MARVVIVCVALLLCIAGASRAGQTLRSHLFRGVVQVQYPATWEVRLAGLWILWLYKGPHVQDGGIAPGSVDIRTEVHPLNGWPRIPDNVCPEFEESRGSEETSPGVLATDLSMTCRAGDHVVSVQLRYWPEEPGAQVYEDSARSIIRSAQLVSGPASSNP